MCSVLVLVLFCRFSFNSLYGSKLTKVVQYSERLNLRPFTSSPKVSVCVGIVRVCGGVGGVVWGLCVGGCEGVVCGGVEGCEGVMCGCVSGHACACTGI